MSSFFKETIKARLFQNKDKYPLLKLNDLLDWSALGDKLRYQKDRERSDRRGNQGYDPLKLFKAVLLGQWHNLSDPELEHALIVRADFLIFCDFDDMEFPDHSTLCRFRQWLIKTDLLRGLLKEINTQLGDQGLKVKAAQLAVIDASIIESSGQAKKKAIEVDKEGHVSKAAASKDSDAQWVKKAGRFYLGYKLHASCDHEGYIENLCVTPANTHESQYLEPLLESECSRRRVLADKGYASKANRALLKDKQLKDGIGRQG